MALELGWYEVLISSWGDKVIVEVKHDVYSMQTAKMKLLLSLFCCVYSRVKLFVFKMNSTVGDFVTFLWDLFTD